MRRVILSYDVDSIELTPGETLVGRGLNCQIRFNDPSISRVHLRLIVDENGAEVQDLSSTNGSLLNGERIVGGARLKDGDTLEVGYRRLRVQLCSEVTSDPQADESTLSDDNEWVMSEGSNRDALENDAYPLLSEQVTISKSEFLDRPFLPDPMAHHCPRCRLSVPYVEDVCPNCKYAWPEGRPVSMTQRIRLGEAVRREAPRIPVSIPILYSSDTLTFDAVARDISSGGMFIATELLDPIGTRCIVTILPDGGAALRVSALVSHVIQTNDGIQGKPPGIGIRFTERNSHFDSWLSAIVV